MAEGSVQLLREFFAGYDFAVFFGDHYPAAEEQHLLDEMVAMK